MRYSPDGTRLAYVAGLGEHPAAPRVTVRESDGVEVTIAPGLDPCWLDASTLLFRDHATGEVCKAVSPDWAVTGLGVLANELSANGWTWARSLTENRIPWLYVTQGDAYHRIGSAFEPSVCPDGDLLTYRRHHDGHLVLDGEADSGLWRLADFGPGTRARWSSRTLVWEWDGRLFGRSTPNVGTVELTIPGRRCAFPVPVWHQALGRLFVLCVVDEGEFVAFEWGDSTRGWRGGSSSGQAFEWDARPGAGIVEVAYLSPSGALVETAFDPSTPTVSLEPDPEPPPLPDIPFTVDPDGVVEDIWPWIANNCTALSPDGRVAWMLKSDEVSADGQAIGEWWDTDGVLIGHLEDSSTGHRVYQGERYTAQQWVALGEPVPWAALYLDRNTFSDGARLWLPRRCVTGYRQEYRTAITWTDGDVWPNIHMVITVDVGYGRIDGREVYVRGVYSPGGHAEVNYYGPTGWVSHTPARRRALHAYVEPARPQPYGAILTTAPLPPDDDMTTDEAADIIAHHPIPPDMAIDALQRFRNEACWPRDQIPAPYTDQVTGGAAALYFWPTYTSAVYGRVYREGVPSGSAEQVNQRWGDYSATGLEAAKQHYWRDQGNPNGSVPPTPIPPGAFSGPIQVAGRDFVS